MALPTAKSISMTEVPVIDLSAMHGTDPVARKALADHLADVSKNIGFFYVSNHGMSADAMEIPFTAAKQFFSLPLEEKLEVSLTKSRHYRGYQPMKTLGDDPTLRGNIHESFHYYLERAANHPDIVADSALRGPNQWPGKLPDFREQLLAYYAGVDELAFKMLALFELGLGLREGTLKQYFKNPMTMIRLLHYPPQPANDTGEHIGVRPHTDNGAFTILSQDNIGGLEILGKGGEWIAVPPVEGTFVINLGEMMKLWSDGIFLATPHRVVNRSGLERYSVPYFLMPDYETRITPLVKNTGEVNEPILHNTVARGQDLTCGEILGKVWNRIWPSRDNQAA